MERGRRTIRCSNETQTAASKLIKGYPVWIVYKKTSKKNA